MSRVKNRHTRQELLVRSLLHRLGFRFRLHRRELPGTPDIVLPKHKVAFFVNGCFWHGHSCPRGRPPATNRRFWTEKVQRNTRRDRANYNALAELGWRPIIVWACETSSREKLERLGHRLAREILLPTNTGTTTAFGGTVVAMEHETRKHATIGVDPTLIDAVATMTESLDGRPSWGAYFMATALLLSTRSSCERLHVGCVVVSGGENPNRIVAAGYNGFLPGAAHRSRLRDGHEQATVHAEQNAISDAARRGVALDGTTIYVTHFPCINCAKILAAAGVREIVYHHDYRNDEIVPEILAESQVRLTRL